MPSVSANAALASDDTPLSFANAIADCTANLALASSSCSSVVSIAASSKAVLCLDIAASIFSLAFSADIYACVAFVEFSTACAKFCCTEASSIVTSLEFACWSFNCAKRNSACLICKSSLAEASSPFSAFVAIASATSNSATAISSFKSLPFFCWSSNISSCFCSLEICANSTSVCCSPIPCSALMISIIFARSLYNLLSLSSSTCCLLTISLALVTAVTSCISAATASFCILKLFSFACVFSLTLIVLACIASDSSSTASPNSPAPSVDSPCCLAHAYCAYWLAISSCSSCSISVLSSPTASACKYELYAAELPAEILSFKAFFDAIKADSSSCLEALNP